jgi:foldase protein PrsA
MSGPIPANVFKFTRGAKGKATLAVAGTAVVLVVAAIAFQVLRPKEGTAAETTAPPEAANRNLKNFHNEQALARVNGEFISKEIVANECLARYGEDVLDNFINRTIIYQACRKSGIEITEAEVNQEIVKIAKKFDIDPENWLRIIQSERHLSPRQYKQDIVWPMLALKKLAGSEIKITEEELQRNFIRDYGERVKARMILCDKLQRAQDVYNLVAKKPEDFGRIAREKSMDPTSKAIDGQIQPIRRYVPGNENLEREAFKLQPDEISGIIDVSTPDARRFVILKCEGRTTPIVKSIDEPGIREQVLRQLESEKSQMAVAKLFERLKKEAEVDNFLTQTSTRRNAQHAAGTATGRERATQVSGTRARGPQSGARQRTAAVETNADPTPRSANETAQ